MRMLRQHGDDWDDGEDGCVQIVRNHTANISPDRQRVERSIGGLCYLDGRGDLFFCVWLRPYIAHAGNPSRRLLRIVKITKGGSVLCRDGKREVVVPIKNVRPIEI